MNKKHQTVIATEENVFSFVKRICMVADAIKQMGGKMNFDSAMFNLSRQFGNSISEELMSKVSKALEEHGNHSIINTHQTQHNKEKRTMCKKISVEIIGEEAFVKTPYNGGFVSAIKKIGGARWTGEAWKIPAEALNEAREMMLKHYGETDQSDDEKITVRATFLKYVEKLTDFVTSLGKTIARATGRDSGARVGEDTVLVKGEIGSGGSMKNWTSWVDKGSVLILHNVSKALYERGYDQYNEEIATYEIVDECADRKAKLNEEKERLLKRLAEIEEELKKQ